MNTKIETETQSQFLDMQAEVGVTKHIGGYEATDELLSLCHIEDAREVLNVGCGIGVGSTYIAKKHGSRVVGVDISEKMVKWSRQRAREARVEDKVEFRIANVLDLPFEDNRFDVVFAESVLIFLEDKARAIRECVRVTKPGGYIGLNEAYWVEQPSPEHMEQVKRAVAPSILTLVAWQSLWEASGLQERVVHKRWINIRGEVRSRIQWIGWWWIIRAWGRALRLYFTNPATRQAIKDTFDVPPEVFENMGYGLFVGRK